MVLGVSHHDLELADLERYSAGASELGVNLFNADTSVQASSPIAGVAVLATCNRVEIYVDALRFHDAVDAVTHELAAITGIEESVVAGQLHVRVGAPVAAHLFAVAAGLDSMVVGEAEISGQVSRTLRRAQREETASPALNRLFQNAARTAKKVVAGTGLGAAGRSVASVALDVAESGDLSVAGKRALIVGTGAYARVVAAALRERGCTDLLVFSPSNHAEAFAATHHARPVLAAELQAAISEVALVVACSGTTGGALDADTIALARTSQREQLTIVDLALRADISFDVRSLPNVRVIDLQTVAENAPAEQAEALIAAQDVVIAAVAEFEDDQAVRVLDPAVIALRSHVSGMVSKEMERLRGKYDEGIAADLEMAMHRVTRSLLHTPTLRAHELARSGDSAGYLSALHTLFGIELTPPTQG
ncbi:glutamyl-tRNA reductase [Nakamurella antarctica]|nr:glutamyl-tRNA reductase [Nakamurella antarctica]